MTLDQLLPGQIAQIVAIQGDDPVAIRLLEMGLIDGDVVELVGRAPWGDPLDIRLRGARVSIRRVEAQRVTVSLQTAASTGS